MALKIYNTLSREEEIFKPLNGTSVGLYTCGPTVYDYPHVGNYRAYIFCDVLKRYLTYSGYNVNHIMNITNIDDKTIKNSILQNKKLKDITEFYTDAFFQDCNSLNIIPATKYTKATDYINEMVKIIEILLEKGFAYKTDGNSIYFDIKKFKQYGNLSNFKLEDLKENAKGRLSNDEYEKENAQDFSLWKAYEDSDGENYWDTSIGKGRPGWHIECSAMSMKELGESFDIHTGGVDNIFPHHENEIAQSECATGKTFVKYWMHNEHLMVDGKKMSKSLGNFYTLRDLINKDIKPLAFRYFVYSGHYRTKINLTIDGIMGSQISLLKIQNIYKNLGNERGEINKDYSIQFRNCMDDDLNTPKALAIMWNLVKDSNISNKDKKATLLDFDKVLGFGLDQIKEDTIPEEVKILGEERKLSRENKDWSKSDELRNKIEELGYEIKDTENGQIIFKN